MTETSTNRPNRPRNNRDLTMSDLSRDEQKQWEQFGREVSRRGDYRRVIPWDPYHLEIVACGLVLTSFPVLGMWLMCWTYKGFYFISSVLLWLVFLYLANRAWREYGKPQEYTLNTHQH